MLKHLFIILILNFCFLASWAQSTVVIKEVLVEAESEKDAIKEQREAGTSKLVVSSKELNNFGHHAAGDVLKRMPRILVQGPPTFNRNIMMAGLDKQFQSILINGNRPAGGEDYRDFKLDRIPVDMIEKIEVIYNPPANYGADASIGLINVILKDTPEAQLFTADLSFDRSSTYNSINPEFAVAYGDKWDKWSFFGSYSLNNFKRNNFTELNDTSIAGTSTEDLKVAINAFTTTLTFEPDSTQKWKYQAFFSQYDETASFLADVKRRTKGGLSVAADTSTDTKQRILHSHTFGYRLKKNNYNWNTNLTFAQHFDNKNRWRYRENNSQTEVSYEDEFQRNTDYVFTSDLKKKWKNHDLIAGIRSSYLDRSYDRMVYTKIQGRKYWDDISDGSYTLNEFRASFYVGDEIRINKWWISPVLRLDKDFGSYVTIAQEGKMDYLSVNPSLHTKYSINRNTFIKADIARQISRPPFNLMVPVDKVKNKKQLIERGNPELVPSSAWNMGLAAEKYFGNNNFVIARGFYSVLRDVIETREVGIDETYGYRIFQSVNVDSGKVWGIDLSTRLALKNTGHNQFAFIGNVSFLGSEVRDPGTQELRKLNEQPQWITNGSIDYINTKLKFQCSLGVNYVGERYISSTIDDGATIDQLIYLPYMQWDARFKYFFSTWGSVYVNLLNIFDEVNELQQGVVYEKEYVGQNIVFGISLRF